MTESNERTWTKRAALPMDEDFVVSTFLISYNRSREGYARGGQGTKAEQDAFWTLHRPTIELLLEDGHVEVISDVEDPRIIYAWAATTGDVVHACIVKRTYERIDPEGAREMVVELLGDRLQRACGYTHELVNLRLLGMLPREWFPAASFLAQRFGAQLARKAAA